MELTTKQDIKAVHQLPKLKLLLKKYRQVKVMQQGLLQLSELANTVNDMTSFYQALGSVIQSLLVTDSFHIALVNSSQELELAYGQNQEEQRLVEHFNVVNWRHSLTGLVFENEQALHCSCADKIALVNAGKITPYHSSFVDWLGVPLKRGNQIIGVVALQSYDEKLYFDDRDCLLLAFIAEHLVTAIDHVNDKELLEINVFKRTKKLRAANKRLKIEMLERQNAESMHKALLTISEKSSTSQDIDTLYPLLHREVNTVLPAKNFYIALLSAEQNSLEFPYYQDEKNAQASIRTFGEGLTEFTINTAQPVLIKNGKIFILTAENIISEQAFSLNYPEDKMPQAWLAAPLVNDGKILGVLAIQDYQNADAYQLADLKLIRFISQHIATAIFRKQALAQIQKHNEILEKVVHQRTTELQQTNANLRRQIEERRKAEAQLYYEAHHDGLTKLPNRVMFLERLNHALRHLKRHPNNRFAVLFIDLDRFKMINDTLGHHIGDLFLVEIAQRLLACVRDNDIIARLGGDEFVVLLDFLQEQDDVEEVAERIIKAINQAFNITGQIIYSNASIGIAQCDHRYKSASDILRDADTAMYQAKSLGRGRYIFFDEGMREQLIATMTLEQELRVAINEQQFELHFQPINDLALSNAIGFEALLRWNHPNKGLLMPCEFLFMAEETGMIVDIESWVIEQVGFQFTAWQKATEYNNAFISINLSGKHLVQVNQLIEKISRHHGEPHRLILEFNEAAFAQHPELALTNLKKLKTLGVKLALDDYCAGVSSLNFLHSYPFEFIKLDHVFVGSLLANEKNSSLVKMLQELSGQFGYRLVAEGIESEAVLTKLQELGCEFGQGYHFSLPIRMSESQAEYTLLNKVRA